MGAKGSPTNLRRQMTRAELRKEMIVLLTAKETDIMKRAAQFLSEHNAPPPVSSPASDAWWARLCADMLEIGNQCNNHPLACQIFPSLLEYLEIKAKARRTA